VFILFRFWNGTHPLDTLRRKQFDVWLEIAHCIEIVECAKLEQELVGTSEKIVGQTLTVLVPGQVGPSLHKVQPQSPLQEMRTHLFQHLDTTYQK
jgi:hypothetical protein